MKLTTVGAATLLGIFAVVVGCGGGGGAGEDRVVASAGDLKVTLADFNEAYNKITPQYRPDISTLEGKRNFANDLVNKEILLMEAERIGGLLNQQTLDGIETARRNKMLELLYREEIEAKVEVLGRDVADLYERRKFNLKAAHILFPDRPTAEQVRGQIASGAIEFAAAAKEHSIDLGTKKSGGALPPIVWGSFSAAFQEAAFELEPGTLSEPVETEFGVHLIKVEERLPQEMGTLEEMRPALRQETRRLFQNKRTREFVAELAGKYNLTWNDDALNTIRDAMDEVVNRNNAVLPPPEQYIPTFSEADAATVVATFNNRDWTIANYVNALRGVPPTNRPATKMPLGGMKDMIRSSQIQNELLVAEAEMRGLDQNSEVLDATRRIREQVQIELVHARFLQAADVPEEDVRAYYDSTMAVDPDVISFPERVDLLIVTHENPDVVADAVRRMRAGESDEAVIEEVSMDTRTNTRGGRTGLMARGNYSEPIEDAAFTREPGSGWSDPIVTQTGTGAIKVLDRAEPRPAEFDEVKESLTESLALARGEAAFEEWLNDQRRALSVKVNDEVLDLIGQSVT